MIAEIQGAINSVKALIGLAREEESIASQKKKSALEALMKAITATRQYLSSKAVREGKGDKAAEANLTELWIAAAHEVEPINSDLAERCFMKAYGWADKVQFESPQFQALRISLDEVAEDIRQIIRD